jgi:succinate-acetate transporter protein
VPELGYWFFALGAITLAAGAASLGENLAISAVLFPLAVGAGLLGVFYTVGGAGWEKAGGYVTMASAFTAFYAATARGAPRQRGSVMLFGQLRHIAAGLPDPLDRADD